MFPFNLLDMKKIIIITFFISLISCDFKNTGGKEFNGSADSNKDTVQFSQNEDNKEINKNGYLFIDIGKIYHHNKRFNILNKNKDTLASFRDKHVLIDGKSYEVINGLKSYNKLLKSEFLYPEYGLFILKCDGYIKGNYIVEINGEKAFINKSEFSNLLTFKTPENYILEAYPIVSKNHPLREMPQDNAEIIDFFDYTYISVEIKGDWLKVRDDKDCYPGEEPSKKIIEGWIRWRKDGKIIINVAHSC